MSYQLAAVNPEARNAYEGPWNFWHGVLHSGVLGPHLRLIAAR
jgi:hypothetical protein